MKETMKYVVLLCILFSPYVFCNAQSVEKRYSSLKSDSGMIIFFRPVKLRQVRNMHKFEYDMTYVEGNDYITLNFTIDIDTLAKVEKIIIYADETETKDESTVCMYRDVLKSSYEIRTSSRISFNDMEKIYKSKKPLIFHVTLSNGVECTATYPRSKWMKENSAITRIVQSIKM